MLRTLIRRSAEPAGRFPYNIHNNPYKAKRTWPPDFAKLSPKHQFRIERKYRRRSQLKWARPRWTKAVKLTQWGTMIFIVVYSVLFMDWSKEVKTRTDTEFQPFHGIREWYRRTMDSVWTTSSAQRGKTTPEPKQSESPSSTAS